MTKPTASSVDASTEIIRAVKLIHPLGNVFELRITEKDSAFKRTHYGYFDTDSAEECARLALKHDGRASIYITVNPCRDELLARVCRRLKQAGKDDATKDHEIKQRRWLPIDLDALRPRDISASAEEAMLAEEKSCVARDYLLARGFPPPIRAFSGNGCHLLYGIDVPNDEPGRELIEKCLKALAAKFDDERVVVDVSCFNASRVWKLYGTMAVKGDHTQDRPHRRARLLEVPETIETVSIEQLEALAAEAPKPQTTAPHTNAQVQAGRNWLDNWIAKYFPDAGEPLPWKGTGRIWKLSVCPWDLQHTNTASITEQPDGKIGAGCFHNSCQGRGWAALRILKEGNQSEAKSVAAQSHATEQKVKVEIVTAQTLVATEYPEPRWAVPDLLPEGTNFLAGPPKLGKTIFALNVAVAVSSGGKALGTIDVELGAVLYLALEDGRRRIKARLQKIAGGRIPDKLSFATEWPRLDEGGLEAIDDWINDNPDARLIVVDTLKMLRPKPRRQEGTAYDSDYEAIAPLTKIASQRVCLLIVHHTRKMLAEDPLATVSGSYGLTGAADGVLVLRRDRGRADAALSVIGRDVEEQELALKFDPGLCFWSVLGKAEELRRSRERQEVIDLLEKSEIALSPKDMAELLDKPHGTVKKLLWSMAGDGEIKSFLGKYQLPDFAPINSGNPGNRVTDEAPVTTVTDQSHRFGNRKSKHNHSKKNSLDNQVTRLPGLPHATGEAHSNDYQGILRPVTVVTESSPAEDVEAF